MTLTTVSRVQRSVACHFDGEISHITVQRYHFLIRAPLQFHDTCSNWRQHSATTTSCLTPRTRCQPSSTRSNDSFQRQSCSARTVTAATTSTAPAAAILPATADAISSTFKSCTDSNKYQVTEDARLLSRVERHRNGGSGLLGCSSCCQGCFRGGSRAEQRVHVEDGVQRDGSARDSRELPLKSLIESYEIKRHV